MTVETPLEERLRETLHAVAANTPIPAPPSMLVPRGPVSQPHRSARRRVGAGALAVAAAATAVTVGVALIPGATPPATASVRFVDRPGYISATVIDPEASVTQLRAAFKRAGLDIRLTLLPVSPSLVGTIVYTDSSEVTAAQQGSCETGGGSCPVGLRIPRNFTGSANVALGRAARAGEAFESSAVSAFAPGEALHCSPIRGETVSAARPALSSSGLRIDWYVRTVPDGNRTPVSLGAVPGTYTVSWADPMSAGGVAITVTPYAYSAANYPGIADFAGFNARLDAGC